MHKTILVLLGSFLVLGVVYFSQTQVQAQDSGEADNWVVRCDEAQEGKPKYCEIFQRLVLKESGQRLLEFAMGTPPGEKDLRGVVVMPLGILLEPGVEMMIDDKHSFKFNVRYCDQMGCFAYLRINDNVLNALKKGSEGKIVFTLLNYKKANIPFSLKGFTKAYKQIN